jgi:hypothetical protein
MKRDESSVFFFSFLNLVRCDSKIFFELSNSFDARIHWRVRVVSFYSWGDPVNFQSREVRTRENRGMNVRGTLENFYFFIVGYSGLTVFIFCRADSRILEGVWTTRKIFSLLWIFDSLTLPCMNRTFGSLKPHQNIGPEVCLLSLYAVIWEITN